MKINARGVEIVKLFEGLEDGDPDTPGLEPYLCPAGVPTIGYGATWGLGGYRVTLDHPAITPAQAEALLRRDLGRAERAVANLLRVPVTIEQFSALVSFTYNLGSGNFQASTLRAKLNRGDVEGASAEFPKWRRAGGRILLGLVRRRAAERALFDS